jgi:hypothetical protein
MRGNLKKHPILLHNMYCNFIAKLPQKNISRRKNTHMAEIILMSTN